MAKAISYVTIKLRVGAALAANVCIKPRTKLINPTLKPFPTDNLSHVGAALAANPYIKPRTNFIHPTANQFMDKAISYA